MPCAHCGVFLDRRLSKPHEEWQEVEWTWQREVDAEDVHRWNLTWWREKWWFFRCLPCYYKEFEDALWRAHGDTDMDAIIELYPRSEEEEGRAWSAHSLPHKKKHDGDSPERHRRLSRTFRR